MKIILFGGSFDPPHRGHLKMIKECTFKCDRLILMPTFKSPLKFNYKVTLPKHRLNMLNLLIDDLNSTIDIDSWEINRNKQSFTYLTIEYLKIKYPNASFSLVIGSDQLIQFNKWKNYKYLIENVQIICFQRNGSELKSFNGMSITWIDNFNIDVSSTMVRSKIKEREDLTHELTPLVLKYINDNKLYGTYNVN